PVQSLQPGVYAQPSAQPQQNPYDFFLEQPAAKKTSFIPGGSLSTPVKIVIFLLGVAGLVVGLLMAYAIFLKPPDNIAELTAVANQQQELIRVGGLAKSNVDDIPVQNFAANANISLTSAQKDLLGQLSTRGKKLDPKKLTAAQDAQTDEALTAAEAANSYDTTYLAIMQNGLTKYQTQLAAAHKASASKSEKELLTKQHEGAGLLLKQIGGQTP
ncbi:MAG TPA: hypothetical protein VK983_03485, partial [Candidatus Limnocylindrales bacterium]|nr:hypothetical protein [Candidatus Limnocylindrales bacterium]